MILTANRTNMLSARTTLDSLKCRKVLLWRCFWALVLVLHAPITWHVVVSAALKHQASLSSIALLTLANAFFLMEICVPQCIGLVRDRRTAVAFMLIIALL